jgi:hypothetical protein
MSLCLNLKHCLGEAVRVFVDIYCCQNLSYTSVHCLVGQAYLPLANFSSSFFTQHCSFMPDYLMSVLSEYKKVRVFS